MQRRIAETKLHFVPKNAPPFVCWKRSQKYPRCTGAGHLEHSLPWQWY